MDAPIFVPVKICSDEMDDINPGHELVKIDNTIYTVGELRRCIKAHFMELSQQAGIVKVNVQGGFITYDDKIAKMKIIYSSTNS
jgi:hypothetical protein